MMTAKMKEVARLEEEDVIRKLNEAFNEKAHAHAEAL